MTVCGAFGCGLIGFGPIGVLFLTTIACDPLKIILFTISAFFWLLGLLTSSLLWFAVVPWREQLAFGLVFSVLIQEVARFLFYLLLVKAEAGLQKISKYDDDFHVFRERVDSLVAAVNSVNEEAIYSNQGSAATTQEPPPIFDFRSVSYSAGLGFALMGCLMEFIYVFYDVLGPGTLMHGYQPGYFFVIAALDSCFMALLQITWSVILFKAYSLRRYVVIAVVVSLHIFLSCLSLLNERASPAPELVCSTFALFLLGFLCVTFVQAGGQLRKSPTVTSIDVSMPNDSIQNVDF